MVWHLYCEYEGYNISDSRLVTWYNYQPLPTMDVLTTWTELKLTGCVSKHPHRCGMETFFRMR